jgi:hypothetical protein
VNVVIARDKDKSFQRQLEMLKQFGEELLGLHVLGRLGRLRKVP